MSGPFKCINYDNNYICIPNDPTGWDGEDFLRKKQDTIKN